MPDNLIIIPCDLVASCALCGLLDRPLSDDASYLEDDEEESDIDDEIRDEELHDKMKNDTRSEDPFNIYDLLNKKQDNIIGGSSSDDNMKYPLGFTPTDHVAFKVKKTCPLSNPKEDREGSICSGHFKKAELPRSGGSMLQLMDDLVKALPKTLKKIGLRSYVLTTSLSSVGLSGEWVPNGKKLLMILVYAPQELTEKKMLWDYLTLVIDKWNDEVVIMGDFNEVHFRLVEGSEQQSEGNKDVKEKDSDDHDKIINLQQWVVLVRQESSVDITPSVVKAPIYDWKIFKDKLREVYQIFRVGQAPKAYPYFEAMLKEFDRDDMVTLWKLVKDRFKEELPKSDLEKCLFWPLKVMFEPVATDGLWQFEAPIKSWRLYKSCRVHCLIMEGMIIYMLDDVEYPLPKTTLQKMLDHKCEVSEFDDDLIQMINLIREQIKKE
ncbi:RNA-directed DNA polymerase, eukaryota, reverse transcriptase zinc-binding domain protein [Tanacetum coccineum]